MKKKPLLCFILRKTWVTHFPPSSILTYVRFSGWLSDCNIAWRASRSWRKSSAQRVKIQGVLWQTWVTKWITQSVLLGIPIINYWDQSFKSFSHVDTKQPSNSITLHFVSASNKTTSCQTASTCGIFSQFVTIQSLNSAYHRLPSSHLQHLARATSGGMEQQTSGTETVAACSSQDKPRNFSCAFPFGTSTWSGSGAQKGSEGCRTGVDVLSQKHRNVIATKGEGEHGKTRHGNHERFFCLTYLWPNLNLAIWLLFASNKSRRMRISRAWWSCICALP